jgi:hypothetical protein
MNGQRRVGEGGHSLAVAGAFSECLALADRVCSMSGSSLAHFREVGVLQTCLEVTGL